MRPDATRNAAARYLRGLRSTKGLLLAIVALAAAIRFATLGTQNFWIDEAVTVGVLRMGFVDMLATIPYTESTPPLYYVLAWVWAKLFGTGEFGLRSLSALLGTAFVPVAYLAGRELVSVRVGLVVAALAAVSPPLVWYAQEARAYSLLVLLTGLSLLFLARALGRRRRALAWWALASAAALATHYFAVFLIAPSAALLLWRLRPPTRAVVGACSAVALVGAALLPLASFQASRGNLARVAGASLGERAESVLELFAAGQTGAFVGAAVPAMGVLVTVAVVAALLPAARGERRVLEVPVALAAVGFVVPFALAAAGLNYVIARNFLPLWLPVAIVVAIGLCARRFRPARAALATAILALSTALVLAVPLDRDLQRESITAAVLKGQSLGGGRNAVRIAYRLVAAGRPATLAASCPPGYAVSRATAARLLSRAPVRVRESPPESGRWVAQAPPARGGGDILRLTLVCGGGASPPPAAG